MRRIFGFIFLLFLIWAGWASFSTGGLYKLKQFNPAYAHPNKSAAYLLSKIHNHESNGFWDAHHVKQCSIHMPDWVKAERCVKTRILCDQLSPIVDESFGPNAIRRDIFSDTFNSCWEDRRPGLGLMGWLHLSRTAWRVGIFIGAVWLTGGEEEWEKNNKGWAKSLDAWLQEGR